MFFGVLICPRCRGGTFRSVTQARFFLPAEEELRTSTGPAHSPAHLLEMNL
jgi:hypothetical protein